MLYVLALEGPTHRERLADLLWDHSDAANNLRVELHRLRKALSRVGLKAFPNGQDPLECPALIEVDRVPPADQAEPLLGLDDISEEFQGWLERQRSMLGPEPDVQAVPLRRELVDRVARQLRFPSVVVLRGSPGSGKRSFARALAQRLDLPLLDGMGGRQRAIHVVDTSTVDAQRTAEQIQTQTDGVWVITQSAFSRESELVLRLRNTFPADRMRYLELGSVPWHEARAHLLSELSFEQAARVYVETGGHLGYMAELLQLNPFSDSGKEFPLPQRVRSAYLLEAHGLPEEARKALDQLSVHPGPLADVIPRMLGFTSELDTLEMSGWLRYRGHWMFSDDTARRVIYRSLHRGRRLHYHTAFATAFETSEVGEMLAAAYHRSRAGETGGPDLIPGRIKRTCPPWARAVLTGEDEAGSRPRPPVIRPKVGREQAILLERQQGLRPSEDAVWSHWVRQPQDKERTFAEYALPDEPSVLHLSARLFSESAFSVGLQCNAYPLEVSFYHGPGADRRVIFGAASDATELSDGTLLLPADTTLDAGFAVHHRTMRIETRSESGVVEFALEVNSLVDADRGSGSTYDLRPIG